MKSFVGYAGMLSMGRGVLVEPVLLCATPEKVSVSLQDYVGRTTKQTSRSTTIRILECPAALVLASLTKADNVLGDAFAQDALRKCLATLSGILGAQSGIELKAVPSKLPGIYLLNIARRERRRLAMFLGLFGNMWPDVLQQL